MRIALVFIFLTVLSPILALAEDVEFRYEADGETLRFNFCSDGWPDEVHILNEDKRSWKLLVEGTFSKLILPKEVNIPKLPKRVKVSQEKTDYFKVAVDGRLAFLVLDNTLPPGQGRYFLPDADAFDLDSESIGKYKNEFYRVISYRTKSGPKTIIVRRSDGKYRLVEKKKVSFESLAGIEGRTVNIPGLEKVFHMDDFENEKIDKIQRLREIHEETERLREDLRLEIYGQDIAINALVNSYRELKTNTSSKPRVILAMGPSGTGKSYTAEIFAELKANGSVMTIKGNEFNAHAGALDYMKLLGSNESSSQNEGSLITWLKSLEGKQGVLIVDEGDKMNPEIWLKLMEFLNTGTLTDSNGNPIKAENLVIFITTNRGVKRMFPNSSKTWSQEKLNARAASLTQEEFKGFYLQKEGLDDKNVLPIEVLNRIDEFIPYVPLTPEAAVGIVKKITNNLRDYYRDEFGVNFNASDDVLKELALADFNGSIDGRAVKRNLSKIYSDGLHLASYKMGLQPDAHVHLKINVNSKGQKFVEIQVGRKSLPLAALGQAKLSPMEDPVQARRLLNLESELNLEIFGQREAMHDIAEATKAHAGMNNNERPLIVFLGGISGNGKTETGRALAKVRYGSESRAAVIPLGGIQNDAQFDNIFGISAQYRGGDIERVFEKALRENPDGGVLIFDEISNMGGGDRTMKTALLMKFYDLFEEGRYISPIDGREFNLGKYTIVLTGNDGQDEFRGMTDDFLLLKTWDRNKSPERMRRMLLASGWPQALVNRVPLILLLKPTLSTEIGRISKKLLNRELNKFQEQNPSVKIKLPENFADQLANAFFAPDQGARGLRNVLETKFRSSLVNSVIKTRAKQKADTPITIKMEIEDTKTFKPYRVRGIPDRKVNLKVTSSQKGQVPQTDIIDLKEHVVHGVPLSPDNARLASFHEAGHAVVGKNTEFITIRPGRAGEQSYYGFASQDDSKTTSLNMDRKEAIHEIAVLWAGRKAQELAGYTADQGWAVDVDSMRRLMTSFLLTSAVDREFVGVALNAQGEPQLSEAMKRRLEKKMAQMDKEGEALAEKILRDEWPLVRSVVAELLKKGEIKGARFRQLKGSSVNSCQRFYSKKFK